MKASCTFLCFVVFFLMIHPVKSQSIDSSIVDVVWLKDGSKLRGIILKWDLERGMHFKLLTGAEIDIPKKDINRVMQDVPVSEGNEGVKYAYVKPPKVYAFRETGWYQNTSGFFNFSYSGGAGIHHAMGYRFSRMLGVGLGTGIETHDFDAVRNIIPVYAEARGFLAPKRVTPYYAIKIGYGFALKDVSRGTIDAKGGFHFSPEFGVRFGGADVNYYFGVEYLLQDATFTSGGSDFGGGMFTDEVSYRRVELRTGLLF